MNRILILFLCILVYSCKNKPDPASVSQQAHTFQSILDSLYHDNPASIGIMAHIESPDHHISWSGGSGYDDKEYTKLLSFDQPALIASSIKTYVSASMLRLQEEGKLNIEDPIAAHLSDKTAALFLDDGYEIDQIQIKHLLSHTSGIEDYVNEGYINFINENPQYRWTRDEQLQRTIEVGDPLGKPQEVFSYADANYLLATEIIEQVTHKPFYEAMRELLKYDQLGLQHTWFPTLEDQPTNTKELVHQYWSEKGWESHEIDISFDLYGGGGIATTSKELAQFSYHLFNQEIIKDTAVLAHIFSEIKTLDGQSNGYGLGLSIGQTKGFKRYGHGGFWGSQVLYFPKLHTSISVFVLEKDVKNEVIRQTIEALVEELSGELNLSDTGNKGR